MHLLGFILLCACVFLGFYVESQCCNGPTVGPCINSLCPNSTMCTNGWCCPGCYDTCANCGFYIQYCNNPYYACSMSGCQATCGKCHW